MPSDLYWIDNIDAPRLAIMARPRAGDWLEDEIAYWVRSGVQIVVSLLEQHEIEDLGLEMEAAVCEAAGIQYLSFPIPDRGLPGDIGFAMDFAKAIISQGKAIAIHCRAGIGRSSVMAATVLVGRGLEPAKALSMIQEARGLQIPDTDAQRDWVLNLVG
jgi:protein-tyrosine phosphatase